MSAKLFLCTCLQLLGANLIAQDSQEIKSGTIVISKPVIIQEYEEVLMDHVSFTNIDSNIQVVVKSVSLASYARMAGVMTNAMRKHPNFK